MMPELALAAFESAIASVKLLTRVIKTTQEVIRFKGLNHNIGELAKMLKDVFKKHEAILKAPKTFGNLEYLLKHIDIFAN